MKALRIIPTFVLIVSFWPLMPSPASFLEAQGKEGGSTEPCDGPCPSDSLFSNSLYISAGWAFGISSQAFSFVPSESDQPSTDSDAEPLLNLTGILGDGRGFALETKVILGNFGRLVELTGAGVISDTTPPDGGVTQTNDTANTAVRRALITDITLRWSPDDVRWETNRLQFLLNTGFMFDAGGNRELDAVNDAASYWFVGLGYLGLFGEEAHLAGDLMVGESELLTGDEPFAERGDLRLRPRLRFHIPRPDDHEKYIDVGFWADLGVDDDTPDAVTVFVAVPVRLFPGD